jgi:hypothetical protein
MFRGAFLVPPLHEFGRGQHVVLENAGLHRADESGNGPVHDPSGLER